MNVREIICYFAIKYKGDWDKIKEAFTKMEKIDDEEIIKKVESLKCNYITLMDEDYPRCLKNIYKPPFILFYYGDINLLKYKHYLGVVGSRDYSSYGEKATLSLLSGLKNLNPVIVSGLAYGIDTIAHKCALENDFKTIAVLGTGIDYCYPKENYRLYDEIKQKGLLISEYPFKECVSRNTFANRNRIIVGLSQKILIPEVKQNSGTLISVRFALNDGKDIFVVPHSIFDNDFGNTLIQEGAKLVSSSKDIVEEF